MASPITPDEYKTHDESPGDAFEVDDELSSEDYQGDAQDAPDAGDFVGVFAATPGKIFVHWSFAQDPFEALKQAFGDVAAKYQLAIRSVEMESGKEVIRAASSGRSQWLDARPGKHCRVDIGLYSAELPFITVLSSHVVRTPSDGISPLADDEPDFHITEEEYSVVLKVTGFDARFSGSSEHDFSVTSGREAAILPGSTRATEGRG